jgi:hypothetical protein
MAKAPTTAAKKPRVKLTKAGADKPVPAEKPQKTAKTKPGKPATRRGTPKGKAVVAARNGGRIGNPKFAPTDEQRKFVETHAACGTPHWLIALEMKPSPISETTLREYFRHELDTGLLRVNARIASLVAKQALSGCKTSQLAWLKSRGGWAEKNALILTGPGGGAVELAAVPRNPDLKKLSTEEVEEYLRIQAKLEGIELTEGDLEP